MLTGKPPLHQYTPHQAILKVGRGEPLEYELPEEVGDLTAVKAFLGKTFAKLYAERPTALQLSQDPFVEPPDGFVED